MIRASVVQLTLVVLALSVSRDVRAEDEEEAQAADSSDSAKTPPPAAIPDVPNADDAARGQAKEVLKAYLDAVQAKKWDNAKKYIHPKALEDIAEIKARTGSEIHGLATWARAAKEAYLTVYKLGEPMATAKGSVAIPTTEEEFDVTEQGTESDIKAEYLLIPLAGKWYVADRRKGDGELFPARTVGRSYKGYFNGEYVAPPAAAADVDKPAKKKKKAKKQDDDE